jgi:hypothetical protein
MNSDSAHEGSTPAGPHQAIWAMADFISAALVDEATDAPP